MLKIVGYTQKNQNSARCDQTQSNAKNSWLYPNESKPGTARPDPVQCWWNGSGRAVAGLLFFCALSLHAEHFCILSQNLVMHKNFDAWNFSRNPESTAMSANWKSIAWKEMCHFYINYAKNTCFYPEESKPGTARPDPFQCWWNGSGRAVAGLLIFGSFMPCWTFLYSITSPIYA